MKDTSKHMWTAKRLRFLTHRGFSDMREKILRDATQVTFLPMKNIGEQGQLDCSITRDIDDVRNGYTQFFDGDILIAKITPCFENGKGALVHGTLSGLGFGTTELIVLTPSDEVDARFLYYITASKTFRDNGTAAMFGAAGQKRVPEEFVRNYRVSTPPHAQQRAIADYLDRETGRLDTLVAAKERLLELLAEKRRAIIYRAATGRIAHEAPAGDPGVSADGDDSVAISRETSVGPAIHLRRSFSVTSGATPSSGDKSYWEGDILWITPKDMTNRDSYWLTDTRRKITYEGYKASGTTLAPAHSIALSKRAPIGELAILEKPACSNQGCFLITPKIECDSRFLYYWLSCHTGYLQSLGSGSTFMELGMDDLKSIRIPDFPVAMQRAIADYLDRETARIDALAARTRDTIALLRERRAALVAAAVTGQIDMECAS